MLTEAPDNLCFLMTSLIKIISDCLMVRSSSFLKLKSRKNVLIMSGITYVPAFKSETTDGRMDTGGTNIRVNIKSFGCDLKSLSLVRKKKKIN